ncbi:MAG: ATP-dependent DNA helicase, partial [Woeseiaceae bacterium]|nr:ATP-dependent DNA helicase [Woeseiaceae bacterium]
EAPREEGRYELGQVLPEIRDALDALRSAIGELATAMHDSADAGIDIEKLHDQLVHINERLALLCSEDSWDGLRWLEVNPRGLRLNLTPLDVSATLRSMINNDHQAWIFTSATLAVGDDFSHFTSRMGLGDATALTFPSPYAVADKGLVWLPEDLPMPSDPEHTARMLEAVTPLLEFTSGGMFCLFTSHRALKAANKWFRANKKALAGRKLLVQGSAPRDDLLRRFRAAGNAVLLGTSSFREGVDVRGTALTIVAIDKLPFASPADPLLMARLEYIRRNGGNGFTEHQVPQAVLAMKQGAGRLLRDDSDYGVIVLCDRRITEKGYGKTFLRSFEPMPSTSSIEDVRAFFERHEAAGAVA